LGVLTQQRVKSKPLPKPPGIVAHSCATEVMHRRSAAVGKSLWPIRYTAPFPGEPLGSQTFRRSGCRALDSDRDYRILLTYKVTARIRRTLPCRCCHRGPGQGPPLSRIAIRYPALPGGRAVSPLADERPTRSQLQRRRKQRPLRRRTLSAKPVAGAVRNPSIFRARRGAGFSMDSPGVRRFCRSHGCAPGRQQWLSGCRGRGIVFA
jgi:hypothetical protein